MGRYSEGRRSDHGRFYEGHSDHGHYYKGYSDHSRYYEGRYSDDRFSDYSRRPDMDRVHYDKYRHDPSIYGRQHQEYEPLPAELLQPAGYKEASAESDKV